MKTPLFSRHPWLYALRVMQKRCFRRLSWALSSRDYSHERQPDNRLTFRYLKHTSKLIRRLGDSDIQLQHNKIINLHIAVSATNGVIIGPKQYFSFCQCVGKPTAKRGFVLGMELSRGEARSGIGGGICQLSNMIHWLALHSPLQVIERANHSFDPFPDEGRVLPFGSGAAIFYNYIDLVLYNPTEQAFQLILTVEDKQLSGELLCEQEREVNYHVYEKNHRFSQQNGTVYRENEIWQDIHTKGHHPQLLQSKCLYQNKVQVKYTVSPEKLSSNT